MLRPKLSFIVIWLWSFLRWLQAPKNMAWRADCKFRLTRPDMLTRRSCRHGLTRWLQAPAGTTGRADCKLRQKRPDGLATSPGRHGLTGWPYDPTVSAWQANHWIGRNVGSCCMKASDVIVPRRFILRQIAINSWPPNSNTLSGYAYV